ncbi:MAG TPA: DUF4845 domain-containing protein [Xanthomonadaceae bacterium]|jgi:hypothetical protein|nr:DUF4845 domain-containing protein [Xanthomonadaceae bacterium]
MRRGQQGITLMGFVIVLIVLLCVAYFAMRVIPMYEEYYGISKALDAVVHDPAVNGASELKIQDMISRHFETGYVDSIGPKDVKIDRREAGVTLSVEYDVSKPLVYNLSLVGHFEKTASTIPGKSTGG